MKTLSSATVEQEIFIAAEKGADAVRDVCALTDDIRLAFWVSQFAPSKIRIGSAHVERRAKVHAALVAEQARRKVAALAAVRERASEVRNRCVKLETAERVRPSNNPAMEVALQHAINALGEAQWAARKAGATAGEVRAATAKGQSKLIRPAVLAALARPGAPTRAALARAAGLAPENLTHWLKERRPIPLAAAERILAALDIEPDARRELGELREQIERAERRAKELLGCPKA